LPDFAEGNNHDKEVKRLNLLEIMDYINQTKGVFNEQTFPDITKMISNNLFRGLAPNNTPAHIQYDPEEDEPVLEVSWPHLQYVYEFCSGSLSPTRRIPRSSRSILT